jgi:hypothetical protein
MNHPQIAGPSVVRQPAVCDATASASGERSGIARQATVELTDPACVPALWQAGEKRVEDRQRLGTKS